MFIYQILNKESAPSSSLHICVVRLRHREHICTTAMAYFTELRSRMLCPDEESDSDGRFQRTLLAFTWSF